MDVHYRRQRFASSVAWILICEFMNKNNEKNIRRISSGNPWEWNSRTQKRLYQKSKSSTKPLWSIAAFLQIWVGLLAVYRQRKKTNFVSCWEDLIYGTFRKRYMLRRMDKRGYGRSRKIMCKSENKNLWTCQRISQKYHYCSYSVRSEMKCINSDRINNNLYLSLSLALSLHRLTSASSKWIHFTVGP